ncbi:M23 family metallopeptidase [Brevundimonas sp. 2R-24]|uniref:M23 family metallopeptidase n=1 Tax=Peiella sedimenti TaxID=3061083 RepID=A0ABT8SJ60_9CAUL|nr:M23 family metallopeptidase [Caulobacteraceae bacterium XZ-24]
MTLVLNRPVFDRPTRRASRRARMARAALVRLGHLMTLLTVGGLAMASAPNDWLARQWREARGLPEPAPPTVVEPWLLPVRGYDVNSRFGHRRLADEERARLHAGVDIAAPLGTPVLAASGGRVLRAGLSGGGYGRYVVVEHEDGMVTLYGHLSEIDPSVSRGASVVPGQRLGAVGSTGHSTGPHLHFEMRAAGRPINPQAHIGVREVQTGSGEGA